MVVEGGTVKQKCILESSGGGAGEGAFLLGRAGGT